MLSLRLTSMLRVAGVGHLARGSVGATPLVRRFASSQGRSSSSPSSSSSSYQVEQQQNPASSIQQQREEPLPQLDVKNTSPNTAPGLGPLLTGAPSEELRDRRVRITIPTRNVMQSGESKLDKWVITWDTRERWENPLMGWISSADNLAQVDVKFDTKEEAMAFCERNGWSYYVHEPCRRRRMKKNYGDNFSWDKRTRKNTK